LFFSSKERQFSNNVLPRNTNVSEWKYKLWNCAGYTDSIKVYLQKDRQCPAQQLTAALATVL
jgi:hypothetical protein